jgi:transposase
MEKVDFRKLGIEAQEALRRRAIYLVETEKKSQQAAGDAVGVSRQAVNGWVKAYKTSGESSIRDGRRISHRKGKGALSPQESGQIRKWIEGKHPEQLKLPFALWTAPAVQQLIEEHFGKRLAIRRVQKYLSRWGYTPQKPVIRAKERSDEKIQEWIKTQYPALAKRAEEEKTRIFWGDETGIQNHDQTGRSYAPKGKTPVVKNTSKKFKSSMISALSNRGELNFMLYDGALNVKLFIEFLKRLIRQQQGRKCFLIVDNLKVHHAKKVKRFLSFPLIRKLIEIHYLPPYAPDYNPDELLNNDLKQQLRQRPFPQNKTMLLDTANAVLEAIQNQPQRIQSYFRHESLKYAA